MPVRIDIRKLAGQDALAATRVPAGAFMADAIRAATGPRAAWHQRIVLTTLYLAELATAFLRRGIVLGGFHGARLDGVPIAYRDGERPVPWWAWLLRAVPCLLAGPVALVRALRVVSGREALHPREPHVFHYLLGRRAGAAGELPARLSPDTVAGWSSLRQVRIVLAPERELGVEIDPALLPALTSNEAITAFVTNPAAA